MKVIATRQPAEILNVDPSLIRSAEDHIMLLHRLLDGDIQLGTEPNMVPLREPHPHERHISLDIETYGILAGCEQKLFHPKRMATFESFPNMVVTAAITVVQGSLDSLLAIRDTSPGDTLVFRLPQDRDLLQRWLDNSEIILGQNISFDVQCLRYEGYRIPPSIQLQDLSVANFLDNESRVERGLKAVGEFLGTHNQYGDRFDYPSNDDPDLHLYNARDTHYTLVAYREFAKRIHSSNPDTSKLSPTCLREFSSVIWNCIHMSEEGVPFNIPNLQSYHDSLVKKTTEICESASSNFGCAFRGKNSVTQRRELFSKIADHLFTLNPSAIPSIEKTPTGHISYKEENIKLFLSELPEIDPYYTIVSMYHEFTKLEKLRTTYTNQILNGPPDKRHINGVVYPTWYPMPSTTEDGNDGGTIQSRLSAKGPAVQTLPKPIKDKAVVFWADLSQIELRIAAVLSGDANLIGDFLSDRDLHTSRALTIWEPQYFLDRFGTRTPDASDPRFNSLERQCGKHANFTDLNLGGAETLQATIYKKGNLKLPLEICQRIVNSRPTARPRLWAWQNEVIEQCIRDQYYEIPGSGHSRHYPGSRDTLLKLKSTMVNFPIQTWAARILHDIQTYIRTQGHAINCQVHDALAFPRSRYSKEQVYNLFEEALAYTSTKGLYSSLCERTGHFVPLKFNVE